MFRLILTEGFVTYGGLAGRDLEATAQDYVIEVTAQLYKNRQQIRGLSIIEAPAVLRHFTAKFEEV